MLLYEVAVQCVASSRKALAFVGTANAGSKGADMVAMRAKAEKDQRYEEVPHVPGLGSVVVPAQIAGGLREAEVLRVTSAAMSSLSSLPWV